MGDGLYIDKHIVDTTVPENTLYTHCKRCGRILKSEESQRLGYGPGCYAKYITIKLKKKKLIRY